MDDVYSAFAKRLGTSREEAKRRAHAAAYSAAPPAVEVLGPGQQVPEAVRYPQVVETREEIARQGWTMRTRMGQRFFVGYEVAYDLQPSEGSEIAAPVVLEAALKQHRAVWL